MDIYSKVTIIAIKDQDIELYKRIEDKTRKIAIKRYLQYKEKQFSIGKNFYIYTEITDEECAELVDVLNTKKMYKRPPRVRPPQCFIIMYPNGATFKVTVYIKGKKEEIAVFDCYRYVFQRMFDDKKFDLAQISFKDEEAYTYTTEVSEVEAFAIMAIPLIEPREVNDILDRLSKDRRDTIEELAMKYISRL